MWRCRPWTSKNHESCPTGLREGPRCGRCAWTRQFRQGASHTADPHIRWKNKMGCPPDHSSRSWPKTGVPIWSQRRRPGGGGTPLAWMRRQPAKNAPGNAGPAARFFFFFFPPANRPCNAVKDRIYFFFPDTHRAMRRAWGRRGQRHLSSLAEKQACRRLHGASPRSIGKALILPGRRRVFVYAGGN